MIKALLFSGYPERFTKRHVIPKLVKFGIEVICLSDTKRPTEKCAAQVDLILCMHEFMSHGADQDIRKIGEKYDLRVIYLSRKASGWNERLAMFKDYQKPAVESNKAPEPEVIDTHTQLPPGEPTIMNPLKPATEGSVYATLVPEDQLENFYRDVMRLSDEEHMSFGSMIPNLKKYFKGTPVTLRRFRDFVQYKRTHDGTPEWFVNWRAKRGAYGKVTSESEASEMETLANEYANEVTKLKACVVELDAALNSQRSAAMVRAEAAESRVKELEFDLDRCKREFAAACAQHKNNNDHVVDADALSVLANLEGLAEHNAIDAKFAIQTLRRFLKV